jgi:ABC-type dipeptide/oligopeptide/nickel transport system ATPase component
VATRPKLIIIRGPSGAGKSTIARAVVDASSTPTALVQRDHYMLMFNEAARFSIDQEVIELVILTCLERSVDVVFEGNFRVDTHRDLLGRLFTAHPEENSSAASGNVCALDEFAEGSVVCVAVPPDDVAADHAGLLAMAGVVGAVEGEVAQRLELSLDPVQPRRVVGVYASSTLFAAAHSPTRWSVLVDRWGEKLSSTIPIRTSGGYQLRM